MCVCVRVCVPKKVANEAEMSVWQDLSTLRAGPQGPRLGATPHYSLLQDWSHVFWPSLDLSPVQIKTLP